MSEVKAKQNDRKNLKNIFIIRLKQVCAWLGGYGWLPEIDIFNML